MTITTVETFPTPVRGCYSADMLSNISTPKEKDMEKKSFKKVKAHLAKDRKEAKEMIKEEKEEIKGFKKGIVRDKMLLKSIKKGDF